MYISRQTNLYLSLVTRAELRRRTYLHMHASVLALLSAIDDNAIAVAKG